MLGTERTGAKLLNSIKRTCERLDLGHTTIYKMIGAGQLETVKIGCKTLVTEASILRVAAPAADTQPKAA